MSANYPLEQRAGPATVGGLKLHDKVMARAAAFAARKKKKTDAGDDEDARVA